MTLGGVLAELGGFAPDAVIHAVRPWRTGSAAVVLDADASDRCDEPPYLLEVEVVRDVLAAWSVHNAGRVPSARERVEAVVHYAEWDCWIGEVGVDADPADLKP